MAASKPKPSRRLAAVALAAGEGKRMHSGLPKVLHEVCGRPALWHVLKAALAGTPASLVVVVGHGADQVEKAVRSWALHPEPVFVVQDAPLGTGHAVMAAERALRGADEILVMSGDDPLILGDHVRKLLGVHRRTGSAASILTTMAEDPTGYGRVIRRGNQLVEIVEEREASPEIRAIHEISTLVYAFRREDLFKALPLVGTDNRQHEYYLPDVLKILKDKGEHLAAIPVDLGGWAGVNSRRTLAMVTRIVRERIQGEHMANGVTFVDPATTYVDVDVRIGRDTVIQPVTFLQGTTRVGSGCTIGPGARVVDSAIGDGVEVTFAVVRGSRIGNGVTVGPYASLRPGTVIEADAKAGSFVEIKGSRVGKRSKVPHLSYVGDATIGDDVNIGAATVTVNYDGFDKHPTVIGDGAHIGSDTMLVAPVRVGRRAWTGAGSVITRDVPDGALAVERTEQRTVLGYDERKRAKKAGAVRKKGRAQGKNGPRGKGGPRGG